MNIASKILLGTVGTVAGYLTVTAGAYLPFVISDARKGYRDDCDYLLILGGRVIGEETPSPHLLERINVAAEYLKENTNCFQERGRCSVCNPSGCSGPCIFQSNIIKS